jgi:hypothetical protein
MASQRKDESPQGVDEFRSQQACLPLPLLIRPIAHKVEQAGERTRIRENDKDFPPHQRRCVFAFELHSPNSSFSELPLIPVPSSLLLKPKQDHKESSSMCTKRTYDETFLPPREEPSPSTVTTNFFQCEVMPACGLRLKPRRTSLNKIHGTSKKNIIKTFLRSSLKPREEEECSVEDTPLAAHNQEGLIMSPPPIKKMAAVEQATDIVLPPKILLPVL